MKQATEKILNRVRKLLAMSKDTTSPNEASIAAKRARVLIDEYQISEFDLDEKKAFDFSSEEYKTNKRYNKTLGVLTVAIAKLNDCQARLKINNQGNVYYIFDGMLVDTVSSVEMLMYLRGEMYMQSMEISGRKNKNSFNYGFVVGVAQQVDKILEERRKQTIKSTGQSLVVVKTQLVENHFGKAKYTRCSNSYSESDYYSHGVEQGNKASLSRQIADNYAAKIGN